MEKDTLIIINSKYNFKYFVNALYKHTKEIDSEFEEEMHRRFVAAIDRCNNRSV